MVTSSNRNFFRVTGPLCGEFTGDRWIPRTKASDAKLWCFSFICAWINGLVNNDEAGDLRRDRTHYDVTVMEILLKIGYHLTESTGTLSSTNKTNKNGMYDRRVYHYAFHTNFKIFDINISLVAKSSDLLHWFSHGFQPFFRWSFLLW